MIVGVVANPYSRKLADHLRDAVARAGHECRLIELATLTVTLARDGSAQVRDAAGPVVLDVIAPYLLYGFPTAAHAIRVLARHCRTQNPVDAVLLADDKAATAVRLAGSGIPQLPTIVCEQELEQVGKAAAELGFPVVVKRTHGAQGRWVRRASTLAELQAVVEELAAEGPGALIVQPYAAETRGRTIRVIVTGGSFLVATQRDAPPGGWKSNIAGGGSQRPIDLPLAEEELARRATAALGLRHAGVDLLRTKRGPVVLEVNACPDFTSMLPSFAPDLTALVLRASVAQRLV